MTAGNRKNGSKGGRRPWLAWPTDRLSWKTMNGVARSRSIVVLLHIPFESEAGLADGRTDDGGPLIFSLLTVSVGRRRRHRTQAGVSLRRLQHRCRFRSGGEPCAGAGKPFHNTVLAAGETLSFNGPFSFEIVSTKWKMYLEGFWAYRVFSLFPCAYFLRRSMYREPL